MSRILADKVTNYNNDGPFEAEKGINIPLNQPLQVGGLLGASGQYLISNGAGVQWQDFPNIFSGSYTDLTNKPVLFSGNYNDLTNKPVILDFDVSSPLENDILVYQNGNWVNQNYPTIYTYTINESISENQEFVNLSLVDNENSSSTLILSGGNGLQVTVPEEGVIQFVSPVVSEYDADQAKDDISSMFLNGTYTGISFTYDSLSKTFDASVDLAEQLTYTLSGGSSGTNLAEISLSTGNTSNGSVTLEGTNGINISWNVGESKITFSKTDPAPYVLPAATTTTLGGVIPDSNDFNIDGFGNLSVNFPDGIVLSDLSVGNEGVPFGNGSLSYNNLTGQFTYTPPLFSLNDLSNVSIFGTIQNQVLRFNGSNWINDSLIIPSSLNDLSDVVLNAISVGDIIQYNGSFWSSGPLSIGSYSIEELSDVTLKANNDPGQILVWKGTSWDPVKAKLSEFDLSGNPTNGQTLIWNQTTSLWDPTTISTGVSVLSDLTDVSDSVATDGYVLTWSSENLQWEPKISAATPGAGLNSRNIVELITQSIADGTADNVSAIGYKAYSLFKIETSAAAWVVLYTDEISRTNDASRPETTDPIPGSGVIAEVITTGVETIIMTPVVMGFNNDPFPGSTIYAKVVNKSGITQSITVSITILQLEA